MSALPKTQRELDEMEALRLSASTVKLLKAIGGAVEAAIADETNPTTIEGYRALIANLPRRLAAGVSNAEDLQRGFTYPRGDVAARGYREALDLLAEVEGFDPDAYVEGKAAKAAAKAATIAAWLELAIAARRAAMAVRTLADKISMLNYALASFSMEDALSLPDTGKAWVAQTEAREQELLAEKATAVTALALALAAEEKAAAAVQDLGLYPMARARLLEAASPMPRRAP